MFKTPFILPLIYPSLHWKIPTDEKVIYLTFDDGPIPEITEFVLAELAKFQAKATFFCIGDNVRKHPAILQQIMAEGHAVGNHTFHHLNGWQTDTKTYLNDIEKCQTILRENGCETHLFRPPYGRIKSGQIRLLKSDYQLVMWDVLTKDYNPEVSPETSLVHTLKSVENGSIVVFHDSLKAAQTMQFVLPEMLKHFTEKGFRFQRLSLTP